MHMKMSTMNEPTASNPLRPRFCRLIALLAVCMIVSSTRASSQLAPQPSVDPFTGTFKCSIPVITIPGPHGGGYTVMLNYSSDLNAEEEASWVGFGWSLEPPRIVREKRGVPDDVYDGRVRRTLRSSICSQTATLQGNKEIIASDQEKKGEDPDLGFGVGGSLTAACNTTSGFDATVGLGPNIRWSAVSVGTSVDTKGRFGIGIGFSLSLSEKTTVVDCFDVDVGNAVIHVTETATKTTSAASTGTPLFTYDPASRLAPKVGLMPPFTGTSHSLGLTFRVGGPYGWEAGGTGTVTEIQTSDQALLVRGYLHSASAGLSNIVDGSDVSDRVLDYLVDRERMLSSGDPEPAPIPVALPAYDLFHVVGTGADGTFRAHLGLPLRVRPARQQSRLDVRSLSLKGTTSPGAGIGGTLPIPSTYSIDVTDNDWDGDGNWKALVKDKDVYSSSLRPFFRFEDDLADVVRYSNVGGDVPVGIDGPGRASYYPVNRGRIPRMNRSVEWHTFGDLRALAKLGLSIDKFGNMIGSNYNSVINHDSLIAFFRVTSESGTSYEFGAPVLSISSGSHSYRVPNPALSRSNGRIHYMSDAEIAAKDLVALEWNDYRYASSWYATAILGPNYVDANDNGPDAADAGSWVKFGYRRPAMRNWRYPYNGFLLDRADVDDNTDDVFSCSSGSAQTTTLRTIETATHIAEFYISSDAEQSSTVESFAYDQRKDHCVPSTGTDVEKAPAPRTGVAAVGHSPYLARVELWKKGPSGTKADGTLLRTVHFSYDYSLQPGNPSSESASGSPSEPAVGKLTLRRIWSEDRDVRENMIEPIDFYYQYPTVGSAAPTDSRDNVKDESPSVLASRYGSDLIPSGGSGENPPLDPNTIDAWGQATGHQPLSSSAPDAEIPKLTPLQAWQTPLPGVETAPWRLKTIRTATGARIVPVYEQRSYSWIQDKTPLMLVPIEANSGDWSRCDRNDENAIVVDLARLGVVTAGEVTKYVANLTSRFQDGGEPLYFKFCYRVEEDENCSNSTGADRFYVRGYGQVREITADGTLVKFKIGTMPDQTWTSESFNYIDNNHSTSPYRLAIRHWKSFLKGKGACPDDCGEQDALSMLALFGRTLEAAPYVISSLVHISESRLPVIDQERCVVRLPLARPKRGGGLRVKRLLAISPSGTLETGDVAAVGTEYIYGVDDEDGEVESWGVATGEPEAIREESALVGIDRQWWPRAGEHVLDELEMAWAETRVPEALQPPLSIGYERVVAKSINPGVNTPGFVVHEFRSARETAPVVRRQVTTTRVKNDFDAVNIGMYNRSTLALQLAQSVLFEVEPVHGLPRSVQTFTGRYADPETHGLVTSTTYIWKRRNEPLFVFDTIDRPLRIAERGNSMDVLFESRRMREQHELNRLDVSWDYPFFVGGSYGYSGIDHDIRTYSSTTIKRFTPHLAGTITFNRGLLDTAMTIAIAKETGFPAVVRTSDAYNGSLSVRSTPAAHHTGTVTAITMPAARMYKDLAQKTPISAARVGPNINCPSVGKVIIAFVSGAFKVTPQTTVDLQERSAELRSLFCEGDEIVVYDGSTAVGVVRVTAVTPSALSTNLSYAGLSGPFVVPTNPTELRLLRSGKRNRLVESSESVVLYGWDDQDAAGYATTLHGLEVQAEQFMDWIRQGSGAGNVKVMNPIGYKSGSETLEFAGGTPPSGEEEPWRMGEDQSASSECPVDYWKHYVTVHSIGSPPAAQTVHVGFTNPSGYIDGAGGAGYQDPCGARRDAKWKTCGYPIWDVGCDVEGVWALVPNTTSRALDAPSWDEWRQFRVGDLGTLNVGTVPSPKSETTNAGGVYFRAAGPSGMSSSDARAVPSGARALAYSLTPYKKFVKTIPPSSRTASVWLPLSSWTYESAYTTDASHEVSGVTGASHNLAGTFALPVPFSSWTNPSTSQSPIPVSFPVNAWTCGAKLVDVDCHGHVVSTSDVLGWIHRTQRDATGQLAQAVFTNADTETETNPAVTVVPWYSDCEAGTGTVSHSGTRSVAIGADASGVVDRPSQVTVTSAAGEAIVKVWIRPQDPSVYKLCENIGIAGTTTTLADSVACSDGWRLFVVRRPADQCSSYVTISTTNGAAVFVDDVVVHAPTASSICQAYDAELRPICSLDGNHFASYLNYDAKGMLATVESETVVGRRRQAGSYANVPLHSRAGLLYGGAKADLQITPFLFDAIGSQVDSLQNPIDQQIPPASLPNGVSAKGDVLDVKIGPDGIKTKSPLDGIVLPKPAKDSTGGRKP